MNDLYVENELKKFQCLSGSTLKLIAIVSMLIDHIGAVIVANYFSFATDISKVDMIYKTCRIVGRTAFPLFCFFAAEGFLHTKNRLKYIIRVSIFAFLSEPAFDIAFNGSVFDMLQQNVMFTIALALIGLYFYDIILEKFDGVIYKIIAIIPIAAASFVAYLLKTDYSYAGVIAITVIYVFRDSRIWGFFLGMLVLAFSFKGIQIFAIFAVIPVLFYNGKKGLNIKYFFYLFYPLHLIAIRVALNFLEKGWLLSG